MAYRKTGGVISYTTSFLPSVLLFQFCLALVRIADWLIFGLRIKGRENLRSVDSAVFVSNHTLVVDPGIIAHVIRPKRSYFTMLEDTALIPYLGTFVRLLGGIPIPQESIRKLEQAVIQSLKTIGFVHFFPEGECYLWNQRIRDFFPGAFYFACRFRVPVVPVTTVLHGRRVFGKGVFRLCGRVLRVPPRVTVVVGEPIYPATFMGPEHGEVNCRRISCNGSMRRAALAMTKSVRLKMQETIDREGGSKTLYRGVMPRLREAEHLPRPVNPDYHS